MEEEMSIDREAFEPPQFSIFSVSSWIPRLAGPRPNDQYYTLILLQYFVVAMGFSLLLSTVLNAVEYKHTGALIFLLHIALLITFAVSYRKFILIDRDIRTSATWLRLFRRISMYLLHLILFYLLLVLEVNPVFDMQMIVSILGSIWVVMMIVVRSQRRAPSVR
jgi:hypothetical protein